MAAKYAKIDRIGSFDAGFQQVSLVQYFKIMTILLWSTSYFKTVKKSKKKND